MQYEITKEPFPLLKLHLQQNESIMCQRGAMAYMQPNIKMETQGGGLGKMFGRMFSGEAMFMNKYTANKAGTIALAIGGAGTILPFNIEPGHDIIVQKTGYLASEMGVDCSVFFQKKFSTGLFGGEGFIMQRLSGKGVAFVEIDGFVEEIELAAGEELIFDTGYLAAMDATCKIDIRSTGGAKNALFGGEGFFNTVVTGPGKVYVQTLPISALASSIIPFVPLSGS